MDTPENQDRERLKEVHATDLTESRVNEEFVDWLKTKGPTWLLAILVVVCGYLGFIRWKNYKRDQVYAAYIALGEAAMPSSKADVAAEHGNIHGITELALQGAGVQLLDSVQRGESLEVGDGTTPPALSDEQRDQNLSRADGFFEELVSGDDQSLGMTLHVVKALNGRAAIAEARGDVAGARAHYEAAASRAEQHYPGLAEQARSRAESLGDVRPITLPADWSGAVPEPPFNPNTLILPVLEDLVLPAETDDGEG